MNKRELKRLIESFDKLINMFTILKANFGIEEYAKKAQELLNLKLFFEQKYKEMYFKEKEESEIAG